jgi:hypothetical protein
LQVGRPLKSPLFVSLERRPSSNYNLSMGFRGGYKRNQVEQAVVATLDGNDGNGGGPDLRVRIKRLLDADRILGRDATSRDPELASYAFYSGEAPGSGVEVWFSSYEAFALLIALRLLAHGWPQGTVVRLLRQVRQDLATEHGRILRQDPSALFDQKKARKQAAPGRLVTGNTDPVFLAIASREQPDYPDRRPYAFAIRRGEQDLMKFIVKDMPLGTATTSLELVNSAHQLAGHLREAQPSRRGRAG